MKSPFALIILCLAGLSSLAQDLSVNEADMFSDTSVVTQAPAADSNTAVSKDEKKTGISGAITAVSTGSFPRESWKSPGLSSGIVGNLYLDARLLSGIKGFANTEVNYYTTPRDTTTFHLRELFVDMNIKNRLYLRAGKQTLQWGRCYLWNPTDLINTDRKTFLTRIGSRDGAFGLKAHLPFGTWLNFYGFADLRGADSLKKTAGSFKTEFTVKSTEMAVEVWGKEGKTPVFGYDISSRLLTLDIAGEAAIFRQDNEKQMAMENGMLSLINGPREWAPRAALNVSRSFDVNGIPDRLTVTLEGYYNGAGYDSRIFEDKTKYRFSGDETVESIKAQIPGPFGMMDTTIVVTRRMPGLTKMEYFLANGLYRPNEHAKYYAALFSTFSRFITSDMSLSLNAIGNIPEKCAVVTAGISYQDLRNLSLGLTLMGYVGRTEREYTIGYRFSQQGIAFYDKGLEAQVTAGISF